MSYTHNTFAQLKTRLAAALGDSGKVRWVDAELGLHLTTALRMLNAVCSCYRVRGLLQTSAGVPFYDLPTTLQLPDSSFPLTRTVTDRDIISELEYHLIEPQNTSGWSGTNMFTFAELVSAVQEALDQFLASTGVEVSFATDIVVTTGDAGRVPLPSTIVNVRRAVWITSDGEYRTLNVSDERITSATNRTWNTSSGMPNSLSLMATEQLTAQIMPIPQDGGTLRLLVNVAAPRIDPTVAATPLSIADDLSWIILWKALSILLHRDGPACDYARALVAEEMYQLGVGVVKVSGVVLHGEVNGTPVIPGSLFKQDQMCYGWEAVEATPTKLLIAGRNMVAVAPSPDGQYSVALDVVRSAPTYADADFVQISPELIDPLMACAEMFALFKSGGVELQTGLRRYQTFLTGALAYVGRRSAVAQYLRAAIANAGIEMADRPLESEPVESQRGNAADTDEVRSERNARRRGMKVQ